MKKILVLGGGGFIGRHLIGSLNVDAEVEIVCFDKHIHEEYPGVKYIHEDVRNFDMSKLIKSCDIVIDLIAYANPGLYVSDPLNTFHICFTENLKIVELCVKYNKRLIQFSTCEVYGDHGLTEEPWSEYSTKFITGPTHEIRWIYSNAKQTLERIIYAYGVNGKLNYTIIRPFNFIGHDIDFLPSTQPGCPRVFSHFLDAILNTGDINLVDGGNQRRAYTYIDDAINCIIKIINRPKSCNNKIFNIGSPNNETSIKDLADLMIKTALDNDWITKRPRIVTTTGVSFYGKGYADITRRIPCIDNVTNAVKWTPTTSLTDTIYNSMAPWFNDR